MLGTICVRACTWSGLDQALSLEGSGPVGIRLMGVIRVPSEKGCEYACIIYIDSTDNPSIRPGLDLRWPVTYTGSTQELAYEPGRPK